MCWKCDLLAPRCRWTRVRSLDSFMAGNAKRFHPCRNRITFYVDLGVYVDLDAYCEVPTFFELVAEAERRRAAAEAKASEKSKELERVQAAMRKQRESYCESINQNSYNFDPKP